MTGLTRNPLAIDEHRGVFDRVLVEPHVRGGSVVTWAISHRFRVAGPFTFYLQWAEHAADEFTDIAGPTTGLLLVDSEQRQFSKFPHSVYRIRMVAGSDEYFSDPEDVLGRWNRHDYLIAREIVRREFVRFQKLSGSPGRHLARMQWGVACPQSTDYQTGMNNDADCRTCAGTGFVGGYHAPTELWIEYSELSVRGQRDENVGVRADQVRSGRIVACPYVTSKDIWIDDNTDRRWFVESKRELAAVAGKTIIWGVELRLVEPSNIAYDLPIASGSSLSGSSSL